MNPVPTASRTEESVRSKGDDDEEVASHCADCADRPAAPVFARGLPPSIAA